MRLGLSPEYHAHLRSVAWRTTKRALIAATGDFCKECGRNGPSRLPDQPALDAHHLTYQRFGEEDLDDLVLLCRTCHEQAHRRRLATARRVDLASIISGSTEPLCWQDVASVLLDEYSDLLDVEGEL